LTKRKKFDKLKINFPRNDPDYHKAWRAVHYYSGKYHKIRDNSAEVKWENRIRLKYIFEHDGEFYMTAKPASEQLPIKHSTLVYYAKNNIVPKPIYYRADVHIISPFIKNKHVGYFSQTQIELMKKVFNKTRKKQITRQQASEYLHENWQKYEKNMGNFGNDGDDYENK